MGRLFEQTGGIGLNLRPERRPGAPAPYPVPQSLLYSNRRTSSKAFSPPKAKEFESATRTAFSRAWLGT